MKTSYSYIRRFCICIFMGTATFLNAQSICGIVREQGSLEPLIGVSIKPMFLRETGTASDENGRFTLFSKASDTLSVLVQYLGYAPVQVVVRVNRCKPDDLATILLSPVQLAEVEVRAKRDASQMPTQTILTRANVKNVPSILGVPDLVRVLTQQPGVTSGEVFSGLYVRGGNDDQNLFVLDGAPIYGASHLFNIVSLFNAEALNQARLYKGVFPARFGGRMASVLDVNFREGSKERLTGSVNVGILNSSALLEMPLGKRKKTSMLLAGRSAYLDLFNRKQNRAYKDPMVNFGNYSSIKIYDINAKINHEFNKTNKGFLNLYHGVDRQDVRDKVNISNRAVAEDQSKQKLTNLSVSTRLYSLLNSRSSLQITSSYNAYFNKINTKYDEYINTDTMFTVALVRLEAATQTVKERTQSRYLGANWSNRIEWLYTASQQWHWRNGIENSWHWLTPGAFQFTSASRNALIEPFDESSEKLSNSSTQTMEWAAYSELEFKAWNGRLLLLPGIRYSGITAGRQTTFEPRFMARFKVNDQWSTSIGASQTAQYLHTLNSNSNRVDKSIWFSSDPALPAQRSRIVTAGFDYTPSQIPGMAFEVEGYYRKSANQVFFKFNPDVGIPYYNFQNNMIGQGTGIAYGVDMLMRGRKGWLDGSIGYSLSRNDRQFADINNGRAFPANYDRRHDLKVSLSLQKPGSKWFFSAFWALHSGHRVTLPVGRVPDNPLVVGYQAYDGINNVQLPTYHRLDVMARWQHTFKRTKLKQFNVTFNVLNAYSRNNPYYAALVNSTVTLPDGTLLDQQVLRGYAAFPILPSISTGFTF
jgi:CarboxypepD_reg-like domain/TonB-dependent Receptor Plug Domain